MLVSRVRVKLCGITRVEDALSAADEGVDAIGLVFYPPSPRCVSLPAAEAIMAKLPPFVTTVGLFLDAQALWVQQVLATLPLDVLQFHGQETADFCLAFQRPYLKSVGMQSADALSQVVAGHPQAQGFLLDGHSHGEAGGTGQVFDWSQWPATLDRPLILAGGLTPDNVEQAIRQVKPWAVDVSSGVEQSKGIKDPKKIREFMRGVQRASAQ